jgi:hypothetical protein
LPGRVSGTPAFTQAPIALSQKARLPLPGGGLSIFKVCCMAKTGTYLNPGVLPKKNVSNNF